MAKSNLNLYKMRLTLMTMFSRAMIGLNGEMRVKRKELSSGAINWQLTNEFLVY